MLLKWVIFKDKRENGMQNYISTLNANFEDLFIDLRSGISSREDSRAFGAMIEKKIADNWKNICENTNSEYVENPGRRTIYDFASLYNGTFYGFDIKTKDLDKTKYSDGGVCAVGNLLKFLANDRATFVVIEFGHNKAIEDKDLRDLEYIKTAPFHLLPANSYRIENLGTGQVRLNYSINQIFEEIEWDRTLEDFFDIFVDLAISHYERVGRDAQKRIDAMQRFRQCGFKNFKF